IPKAPPASKRAHEAATWKTKATDEKPSETLYVRELEGGHLLNCIRLQAKRALSLGLKTRGNLWNWAYDLTEEFDVNPQRVAWVRGFEGMLHEARWRGYFTPGKPFRGPAFQKKPLEWDGATGKLVSSCLELPYAGTFAL